MQVLSLGRPGLAQTALVYALTLAALALFGLVLAYWTWVWFAPRAEPRAEAAAGEAGNLAIASRVFGRVERNKNGASPTGIAIKLFGIVAASSGRRGYAVVQLDAKQILAVHEGEDVTPGVRLAEVLRDHVILERGGVRETLAWPEKKGSASPSAQAGLSAAPRPAEAAAPRPAEPVAPQVTQPAAPQSRRSGGRRNESD
jgi:general secretion pathway protein C